MGWFNNKQKQAQSAQARSPEKPARFLTKVIAEQYLKIESNHALIISGDYGIGKTHYVRTELFQEIESTPYQEDESKCLKAVHISLFGLKTLDELQSLVFLEIYGLNKPAAKKTLGFLKPLGRIALSLMGFRDFNNLVADFQSASNKTINFKQVVICFDDVDRKAREFKQDEFFGFVNTLVENIGVKIIIVAKEDELKKDINYGKTKEKVGVVFPYQPETEKVFHQILAERYKSGASTYYNTILGFKDLIIRFLLTNGSNFRNLIFFLERFRVVFSKIEAALSSSAHYNRYKRIYLESVVSFMYSLSIEFKEGRVSIKDEEELRNLDSSSVLREGLLEALLEGRQETPEEVKDSESEEVVVFNSSEFMKTYFTDRKLHVFESIIDYILGIKPFDMELMTAELNSHFSSLGAEEPPEIKVYNALTYPSCFSLSIEDYERLTLQMLEYVLQGKYQLQQSYYSFGFAMRFDNRLDFDAEAIKGNVMDGIKRSKKNLQFQHNLGMHLSISAEMPYYNETKEVYDLCLAVNSQLEKEAKEKEIEELFNLFNTDFKSFLKKVDDRNSSYFHRPLWCYWQAETIFEGLKNFKRLEVLEFGRYYRDRVKLMTDSLSEELTVLEKMVELTDDYLAEIKAKSMDHVVFGIFKGNLEEAVEILHGS